MKKLIVLAMTLGLVLAMPIAAGATEVTDPSPSGDQPYDAPEETAEEEEETTTEEEETTEEGTTGGDDDDQAYDGDDEETTTDEETTEEVEPTTEANTVDPTKSPKTADTSKAGAAACVVVIAGVTAIFTGKKFKKA